MSTKLGGHHRLVKLQRHQDGITGRSHFDDTIVHKRSAPLSELPRMDFGSMANDGGGLILEPPDYQHLLAQSPEARPFIRELVGSDEFINGTKRWCLWINDEQLEEAQKIPLIAQRIEITKRHRAGSDRDGTKLLAANSHKFGEIRHKCTEAIVVPIHFSEDREYLTLGFVDGNACVISNACYGVYDAEPYIFAILSSRLHAVWVTTVCGQLETRIRYSNTLGYHTFPVPALSNSHKRELEEHTIQIISARESHPGKTIAWLYDPESMPENIRQAHKALDDSIERIYIGRSFQTDTERLEFLFRQYALMIKNEQEVQNRLLPFKKGKR